MKPGDFHAPGLDPKTAGRIERIAVAWTHPKTGLDMNTRFVSKERKRK